MPTIREGECGPAVEGLQAALLHHGFSPGKVDGAFGPGTEAALLAFQRSAGLSTDGIAGPATAAALGLAEAGPAPTPAPMPPPAPAAAASGLDIPLGIVCKMFPATPIGNIKANLPVVLSALSEAGLASRPLVLAALATIRAETESFEPISEGRSRFNTSPDGHPFDLYDNRRDLGNRGAPDGANYRGRGFVQLTGRTNYTLHGAAIGLPHLVDQHELANEPAVAARLLAAFMKAHKPELEHALQSSDLRKARRIVNGGSNGLDRFVQAYETGARLLG